MKKITKVGLGLSIRHGHNDWPAGVMDLVTNNGEIKGPDMLSVHHYLGSMKDEKCGDAVDYTDEEYYYLLDSLEQYRLDIDFHRRLIEGSLPQSIGGGIGQSRLCMVLLHKAHVGETQSSIWPEQMRDECRKAGMTLI